MDQADFERLVILTQAGLLRYLIYLGAGANEAEDIAQNAYVAAWNNAKTPADEQEFVIWLRAIARNQFYTFCQKKKRDLLVCTEDYLTQAEAYWRSEFLRDNDGFDYVEALRACLETLPPKQRQAVTMRYAEQQSRTKMAEVLAMTENSVRTLLQRIRAALGDCVSRRLTRECRG